MTAPIFGLALGAYDKARDTGKAMQEADADRAIRQATALAGLQQLGIVGGDQAKNYTDATPLGNTGYSSVPSLRVPKYRYEARDEGIVAIDPQTNTATLLKDQDGNPIGAKKFAPKAPESFTFKMLKVNGKPSLVKQGNRGALLDLAGNPIDQTATIEDMAASKPAPRDPVADYETKRDYAIAHPLPTKPGHAVPQQHVIDPMTGDVKFFDPTNPPSDLHINPRPAGGGSTGGMGSGGIGGLARTDAAITGMVNADTQMTQFENTARSGAANYDGLDYFQGLMAKMYDASGVINQGVHAAAFARLNQTNPALANYLRAAEQWALEDATLSGRPSDFRTKLDSFVSAIGPNSGGASIDNVQHFRGTRLQTLKKFQPAIENMAERAAAGPKGGKPPTDSGNIDLRQPDTTTNIFARHIPKKGGGE